MDEYDWIQLWVLNELVCSNRGTKQLLNHPDAEPIGYWAFPARAALHANSEARLEALRVAVNEGLIDLYPRCWLHNPRFALRDPIPMNHDQFQDLSFLDQTEAVLTYRGHETWERGFQPSWERFWTTVSETYDESTQYKTASVAYASNEILDELLLWLPAYWCLDTRVNLEPVANYTTFQFQAGMWKLIPCVKVITWKCKTWQTRLKELMREARASGPPSIDGTEKDTWPEIRRLQQTLGEACVQARRILTRLSNKWDCVDERTNNWRDAEPQLRVRSNSS
jgi:hypothetical protein